MLLNGCVLWPFSNMRDDEDPFEWRKASIELASSRATTTECQIAQCNALRKQITFLKQQKNQKG
ncbi:hypothetical protein AYR62_00750 [Secundilactobacillus paracollinoides]|nr:hypothetical protein AYR62_00750 [Secundilactobacillus paracollinoides]